MDETLPSTANLGRFLRRLALFAMAMTLVSEGFFRWVVPASETPVAWQDATHKLRRSDPNGPRDGLFTSGRLAEQRARWHINAQGWNCPMDYLADEARGTPVIAFGGDSQFESLYVEWPGHIAARVQAAADNRVLGYSYGGSGYKLTQYILVARHIAAESITPRALVLLINQGDFHQSLMERGGRMAYDALRIEQTPTGFTEVLPLDLPVTRWRRALRDSALARYVVFNAKLNPWNRGPVEFGMQETGTQAEASAGADPLYVAAFEYTVRAVREALPKTRLFFLIDADRATLYRTGARPPRLPTSAVVTAGCTTLDCGVIDLTDVFTAAFLADGRKLNFEHNFHWNTHGHDVAATEVARVLAAEGLLR